MHWRVSQVMGNSARLLYIRVPGGKPSWHRGAPPSGGQRLSLSRRGAAQAISLAGRARQAMWAGWENGVLYSPQHNRRPWGAPMTPNAQTSAPSVPLRAITKTGCLAKPHLAISSAVRLGSSGNSRPSAWETSSAELSTRYVFTCRTQAAWHWCEKPEAASHSQDRTQRQASMAKLHLSTTQVPCQALSALGGQSHKQ